MSNVVIDTSERSIEEQIDAATAYYRARIASPATRLEATLRALCAGEFSKAPMPEIRKPKWASWAALEEVESGKFFVYARGPQGCAADGAKCDTEREAILAFNDLFGGAP